MTELLETVQEPENIKTLTRDYILSQIIGKVGQVKWGFKVLVVDQATMRVLDASLDMKQVGEAGVSDVAYITATRLPLPKMDAIYFLAPTDENVKQIAKDFENPDDPAYKQIHIFFTSKITEPNMKFLAQSKAIGRIKTLKEVNLDFLVYDSHTFHFNSPKSFFNLYSRTGTPVPEQAEIADKLASALVTIGEYPIVRYAKTNGHSSAIASLVHDRLERFRRAGLVKGGGERSSLLILDRTHDLVTPLLHDLTYMAMVEDLVPLTNDVFSYSYLDADNKAQNREVILNENDVIWKHALTLHIQHAKTWIANEFKKFRDGTKDMAGGHDITKTLRAMPKFQTLKAKFSVHLNLAKECMDTFNRTSLERVCALEQDLATGVDEYQNKISGVPTRLTPLLNDGGITKESKIRLLMLYYLTEEKATDGRQRFEANARLTGDDEKILSNSLVLKESTTRTDQRRKPQSDQEWEFVVSRYLPHLHDVINDLAMGKLTSKDFPFLNKEEESQTSASQANMSKRAKPTAGWGAAPTATAAAPVSATKYSGGRLIIFIAGGVSYAEIREVHKLSKQLGRDVIIGSTHIVKPNEYIAQIGALSNSAADKAYVPPVISAQKTQ